MKALELHWDTSEDTLYIPMPDTVSLATAIKSNIASVVANTFDLMDWFFPATLPAKLLIQETWKLQVSWDEPLPDLLQQRLTSGLK